MDRSGLADLPRAVLSAAFGVIDTAQRVVAGDKKVRTARSNAWEAVCADRARADQRDAVRRHVAMIVTMPARPAREAEKPALERSLV